MKRFPVYLIAGAEDDLRGIYDYVAANDSPEKAERLLNNIEKVISGLETLPDRGRCPSELERVGVLDFREVFFKPYRIIYQVIGEEVYVHCILDGRRDMQELLQMRILRV